MDAPLSTNLDFVEPTLKHAIMVWWAWTWRVLLLGAAGGACIGVLLGLWSIVIHIHILRPVPARHAHVLICIMFLIIFLTSFAAQVWAFRLVLRKTFKKFSIRLVKYPCG
jgi:hypothetical protein